MPNRKLTKPGLSTLFLTGAGGTGKTYVAEALLRKHGDKVALAPSYTREGYKVYGIQNERQKMKMDLKEQVKFQIFLLDYFINQATEFIKQAALATSPATVCILQRSPLDYMAHTQQVGTGLVDWKSVHTKVSRFFDNTDGRIVYFPFPAPWSSKRNDGFRMVDDKKEVTLDMDILGLMRDYQIHGTIYLGDFNLQNRIQHIEDAVGLPSEYPQE